MSFINNYRYDGNYGVQVFECPDGDHDVKIVGAEVKRAKSGREMIEVQLLVRDGTGQYVDRYVEGEYFDKNISRFFDAFGISPGTFDFRSWIGKRARGHFVHKEETYADEYGAPRTIKKAVMQYLIVPENRPPISQNQSGNNTVKYGKPAEASGMWHTEGYNQGPQKTSQVSRSEDFQDDIPF